MFSPDHAGQWQVEVQDGLGHRLALDLEVAGDKAEPEDKGPQIPRGSMGMSRTAEVIIGLSIIFGIFGFLYGWKARHAVQCRPREGCDQVRK
jgi:nickel transport protein